MIEYIRVLKESELGYIAGCFDGEGHIAVRRRFDRSGVARYWAEAKVSNTNVPFLEWLEHISQVGIILLNAERSDKHKAKYIWSLRNKDMNYLLPQLLPYLVIKKTQAEYVLEFLKLRKGNRYSPFTLEELNNLHRLYSLCQELNARGPNAESQAGTP